MRISQNNINRGKFIKPIAALNNHFLARWDMKRRMGAHGMESLVQKLTPTGNLSIHLADNANKYSKMKLQGDM